MTIKRDKTTMAYIFCKLCHERTSLLTLKSNDSSDNEEKDEESAQKEEAEEGEEEEVGEEDHVEEEESLEEYLYGEEEECYPENKLGKLYWMEYPCPPVQKALRARGWVEKRSPVVRRRNTLHSCDQDDYMVEEESNMWDDPSFSQLLSEVNITWRLVRNRAPTILWLTHRESFDFRRVPTQQLISRFNKATFTTKVGLCQNLQQVHWYPEASNPLDSFFPRCYCIGIEEDRNTFIQDFRLTACLNMVKWVVEKYQAPVMSATANSERSAGMVPYGSVPLRIVERAVSFIEKFVCFEEQEDLEKSSGDFIDSGGLTHYQWAELIQWSYQISHYNGHLAPADHSELSVSYESKLHIDGLRNIWIVKPGAQSRGRGIILMDRIEDILQLVTCPTMKDTKYVVQKYIERPFLIYDTKFDIRQWLLVTDFYPLTLWMYKECYIRFCSQTFDLENHSEVIHLSNNAVQRYYQHLPREYSELPLDNMWDSTTLQKFLNVQGYDGVWESVIYPGMRDALVGALLTSQDEMDVFRRNSFEFFGADFMLSEDMRPWLIEINACPAMSCCTEVTSRLCPQCFEDIIKVVIDWREDHRSDTGQWELVFRQPPLPMHPSIGVNLEVRGTKVRPPPPPKSPKTTPRPTASPDKSPSHILTTKKLSLKKSPRSKPQPLAQSQALRNTDVQSSNKTKTSKRKKNTQIVKPISSPKIYVQDCSDSRPKSPVLKFSPDKSSDSGNVSDASDSSVSKSRLSPLIISSPRNTQSPRHSPRLIHSPRNSPSPTPSHCSISPFGKVPLAFQGEIGKENLDITDEDNRRPERRKLNNLPSFHCETIYEAQLQLAKQGGNKNNSGLSLKYLQNDSIEQILNWRKLGIDRSMRRCKRSRDNIKADGEKITAKPKIKLKPMKKSHSVPKES